MRKATIILILTIFSTLVFAQDDEVFITIGNEKIATGEFMHLYKKNNTDNLNSQSLDEYLKLFKQFKLKVVEAQNLKMDTSSAFKNELQGYKDQLAKPYLTESIKYDELLKEAYERNKTEIKLDIIFLKLSKYASYEDTALVYEKAMKIRNRILSGENFEKVATETSDDRQVSQNKGHLSYLSVLSVPYKIQSYVFNAKKGELSLPIRTTFGYYLIKLISTRPARGFYKVSHIMINAPNQLTEEEQKKKKARIDSIYNRIKSGDKYEDLVKYSDDKGTAVKGGELPEFTTGKMVPEFEEVVFSLKTPGEISKPFKSRFGWHIIKMLEKRPPGSFDQQKDMIKKTVERDPERKEIVKKYVINKLKKENRFVKISDPNLLYTLVDSTVFMGNWKLPVNASLNNTLFLINGKKYTENSLAKFIENKQKRSGKNDVSSLVNSMVEEYIYESLLQTEKQDLEGKFPTYRFLMKEYHDGMLIFDLMKKEVWDKASMDSIGLKKFYEKNKVNYNTQIFIDISVFKYSDLRYYNEAVRLLNKDRDQYNDELLVEKVSGNKKDVINLVESGSFAKGESLFADKVFNLKKENKIIENQKIINFPSEKTFIYLNKEKVTEGKKYNQIKGLVISDYQEYLEAQWVKTLESKYKITVNEKILKDLKNSLK